MDVIANVLETLSESPWVWTLTRTVLIAALGLLALRATTRAVKQIVRSRFNAQGVMLIEKFVFYGGAALLLTMILGQMGFQLTALLGAAGIMGVAIGFASQASLSNVISGLFLISEKPMAVGDVITAGNVTGIVLSIDLLSVKLRTFDNRFARIPNEQLLKSELINFSRFPIRRFDINLGVAYKEDIGRVMDVLRDIADKNPFCLDEPEPLILFTNFGNSSLDLMFGVWFHVPDFLALRKSLMREIKERFDAEGIEIPFPHMTLYTGSVTDPFPVQVTGADLLKQAAPASATGSPDASRA